MLGKVLNVRNLLIYPSNVKSKLMRFNQSTLRNEAYIVHGLCFWILEATHTTLNSVTSMNQQSYL